MNHDYTSLQIQLDADQIQDDALMHSGQMSFTEYSRRKIERKDDRRRLNMQLFAEIQIQVLQELDVRRQKHLENLGGLLK